MCEKNNINTYKLKKEKNYFFFSFQKKIIIYLLSYLFLHTNIYIYHLGYKKFFFNTISFFLLLLIFSYKNRKTEKKKKKKIILYMNPFLVVELHSKTFPSYFYKLIIKRLHLK